MGFGTAFNGVVVSGTTGISSAAGVSCTAGVSGTTGVSGTIGASGAIDASGTTGRAAFVAGPAAIPWAIRASLVLLRLAFLCGRSSGPGLLCLGCSAVGALRFLLLVVVVAILHCFLKTKSFKRRQLVAVEVTLLKNFFFFFGRR